MTPLLNEAPAIFLGDVAVEEVYLGDVKVWPSKPPMRPLNIQTWMTSSDSPEALPTLTWGGALVSVAYDAASVPSGVTLNGVAGTEVFHVENATPPSGTGRGIAFWWVPMPPAGPADVQITWDGTPPSRQAWAVGTFEDVGPHPTFTHAHIVDRPGSGPVADELTTDGDVFFAGISRRGNTVFTPEFPYQDPFLAGNDNNSVGLCYAFSASMQVPVGWVDDSGSTTVNNHAEAIIGIHADPTPVGVLLWDEFDCGETHELNLHSTAGHTKVGAWADVRSIRIGTNPAGIASYHTDGYDNHASFDAGTPDVKISTRIIGLSGATSGRGYGVFARSTGPDPHAALDTDSIFAYVGIDGVVTLRVGDRSATTHETVNATEKAANPDDVVLTLIVKGTTAVVQIDGVTVINHTVPAGTGTHAGLYSTRSRWSSEIGYDWIKVETATAVPLVLTFQQAHNDVAIVSNYATVAAVPIGAESPTREVVVVVGWWNTGSQDVRDVTIGGVDAIRDEPHIRGTSGAEVWRATVPTGTTADIVVHANRAGAFDLLVWTSPDPLVFVNGYAHHANDAGLAVGDPEWTVTVPSAPDGAVVAGVFSRGHAMATDWTGVTERFEQPNAQPSSGGEGSTSGDTITVTAAFTPNLASTETALGVWTYRRDTRALIIDSFDRPDADTLGDTDTGQTWTVEGGTYGIRSQQAATIDRVSDSKAWVDLGVADMTVTATFVHEGSWFPSLKARMDDDSDYSVVHQATNRGKVSRHSPTGASGSLGGQMFDLPDNAVVALTTKTVPTGVEITVTVNGTQVYHHIDPTAGQPGGTRAGFTLGNDLTARLDNFKAEEA